MQLIEIPVLIYSYVMRLYIITSIIYQYTECPGRVYSYFMSGVPVIHRNPDKDKDRQMDEGILFCQ